MNTRITAALLSSLATFLYTAANAQTTNPETVRLVAADDGTLEDELPFDGIANQTFLDSEFVAVQMTDVAHNGIFGDRRAVVEFDVSSLAGRTVRRAIFRFTPATIIMFDEPLVVPVEVRGYRGDGMVRLNDFYRGTFVATFDMRSLVSEVPRTLDVTKSVRHAVNEQWPYQAFVLRTNVPSGFSFFAVERGHNPPALVVTVE